MWQQLELASELEYDLRLTVNWGTKKWLLISVLEKLNLFCLIGQLTLVLLM